MKSEQKAYMESSERRVIFPMALGSIFWISTYGHGKNNISRWISSICHALGKMYCCALSNALFMMESPKQNRLPGRIFSEQRQGAPVSKKEWKYG
jgi:hypothetical protein